MNNIIKVLIADDHELFRTGIIRMLSNYPDISIIAEAENGEILIKKYFENKPDITLVDISMPVLSGLEAVKKIINEDNAAKVLFLSMYDSPDYVYSCLISGGMGLVNKNISEGELVLSIRTVFAGNKYFGKDYSDYKLKALLSKYQSVYLKDVAAPSPDFTNRELQILKLVGKGYSSSAIAEELHIGIRTVDTHRQHLTHKLNLKTSAELINYAVQYILRENI